MTLSHEIGIITPIKDVATQVTTLSDTTQKQDSSGVGPVTQASEIERLERENQRLARALNGAERCCRAIDSEQRVLVPALKKAEAERDALLKALEALVSKGLSITLSRTELKAYKQLVKQVSKGHYRRLETLIDLGLAFTKHSDYEECEMRNKNLPVVAKIIPAGMGKGPSFQVVNLNKDQRDKIVIAMHRDEMKASVPSLNGDQPDWIMVEFLNHDQELVNKGCELLAKSIGASITAGSEFTREELGLI